MQNIDIKIDAGRLLFGLSRIGYTTVSALCDILDNAVRAKAKNIHLKIVKESEHYADNRRNNVSEYIIIDDGTGMNEIGIQNALSLGASNTSYEPNSLSKFGLGLKSAAFSQGDELYIISSDGSDNFIKYGVSMSAVQQHNSYFATKLNLDHTDQELIAKYLSVGHGTIIRLAKINKVNHPSVKSTQEELNIKVGVIYYYFIQDDGINIFIGDEQIKAFDVLFTQEANQNGNLNEHEWEGKLVKWIEKPKSYTIDTQADISATIEVTQLPHPPTFLIDTRGGDDAIRKQYLIGSQNYGFYVYRNKRLISWADRFSIYEPENSKPTTAIIGQDQDLYSFRGRILINDSADECFNIDVKKSSIILSNEAWNSISDLSMTWKNKSRKAWNYAKKLKAEKTTQDTNQQSNNIASDYEATTSIPGTERLTDDVIEAREKEMEATMKDRLFKAIKSEKNIKEGKTLEDISPEIINEVLKGEDTNPASKKIFRVSTVLDNNLWEPYYDCDNGTCVRINKNHRFGRLVFEENESNADLQVLLELMMLQFSEAEVYALQNMPSNKLTVKELEKVITEYRRYISEFLADMCRKLDGQLPPLK